MLSFAGLAGSSIESAYWWVSPPYHQALSKAASIAAARSVAQLRVAPSPTLFAMSARSRRPRIVYTVLSSFSTPMPLRSTLPSPSGQPSPSSSSCPTTYRMLLTVKS